MVRQLQTARSSNGCPMTPPNQVKLHLKSHGAWCEICAFNDLLCVFTCTHCLLQVMGPVMLHVPLSWNLRNRNRRCIIASWLQPPNAYFACRLGICQTHAGSCARVRCNGNHCCAMGLFMQIAYRFSSLQTIVLCFEHI